VPATVSVDGWSVGRSPAAGDSAVRCQITDARSPTFPRCLDTCNQQQVTDADEIGSGCNAFEALLAFSVGSRQQAVVLALAVSSSGNLSVSVLCCSD